MSIKELRKVLTKELILSKEIFLVGHNNIDLDAFASMAGFSLLAKKYKKHQKYWKKRTQYQTKQ